MHYDGGKQQTRILEQNILNLSYGQFQGVGQYDMPKLYPITIDNLADIPIQGFNYALKEQNPEKLGVHFFLHDYQFERVWKYPDRYVEVLKKFAYVLSPDFSPYADMPKALQIYNVYRNRWCARYWQEHGIKVIPTITIGSEDLSQVFFDGVPTDSTIAISTMGEGRWGKFKGLFSWWDVILYRLRPKQILLYGKDLSEELTGDNIVFKKMINTKVAV